MRPQEHVATLARPARAPCDLSLIDDEVRARGRPPTSALRSMSFDRGPLAQLLTPGAELRAPRALVGDAPARAEPKPVWAPETVGAAIAALEAGGAAIVCGTLLARCADGAGTAPLGDAFDPVWRCTRPPQEPWAEYVRRSAAAARDAIEGRLGAAEREGIEYPFVDLAWTTADEPRLFDVPAYLREGIERVPETGGFFAGAPAQFEHLRVVWTAPAPGSFYAPAAPRVREIPAEARFARVDGRAKDIAALAERSDLEVLEVHYAGEAALAAAAALPRLRHLELSDLRSPTLDALRGHGTLATLRCAPAGRLRDAPAVAELPALRALFLDVDGVRDLASLAGAAQLEALCFTGSLITLPSLAPLASLARLRHLWVGHVRVKDGSLRPLHGLAALETIELPERFTVEELAALSAALPRTAGLPDQPFVERSVIRRIGCPRCRGHEVVETVGKPVRLLCRACDDAKLRKHALRWEMALAAAPSAVAEARAEAVRRVREAREREEERLRPRVRYVEADDIPVYARRGWVPVPRPPEVTD